MSDKLTAAGRVKIGTIFGADQDSVPLNRRYYGGGGGSVRGFEYQSISPKNEDGESIGGRSLIEASAELRYRGSGKLGYAATPTFNYISRSGSRFNGQCIPGKHQRKPS